MRVFDAGFAGSIMKLWKKLVRAEKQSLSNLILYRGKNIVLGNVNLSIIQDLVDLNISSLKRTQLRLKKVKLLGIRGLNAVTMLKEQFQSLIKVSGIVLKLNLLLLEQKVTKILNGKLERLGILLHMVGYKEIMGKHLFAKTKMQDWGLFVKRNQKIMIGLLLIKKVMLETENNIYNSVILAI